MPGLVGVWNKYNPEPSLDGAFLALQHFPSWTADLLRPCGGLAVGSVQVGPTEAGWRASQDGLCLFLWGEAFSAEPLARKMTASDLLVGYISNSFSAWLDLEGCFVIVLVDTHNRRLHIFNDRLGLLPLYYLSCETTFSFGPEPKAVFKLAEKQPELSPQGVACFLSCAYNFAGNTIYKSLRRLEPASILTLQSDSLSLKCEKYWNLVFDPDKRMSETEAGDSLYVALVSSHKLLMCDQPAKADIMLSGGADSRAMMGLFQRFGPRPRRLTAFGATSDLPLSDAEIAGRIANDLRIPFDFLLLEQSRFPEVASKWAVVSELANDNFNWYANGLDMVRFFTHGEPDCILRGDESWGWGNLVKTRREAIAAVLPVAPDSALRRTFTPAFLEDFTAWYGNEIESVASKCQNELVNEFKDYLYLAIRVFGFIAPLGYYMAAPVRRTLLTREILDSVRRMPCSLRANKMAFRSMMRRKMPDMMRYPLAQNLGGLDWPGLIRNDAASRDVFERMLSPDRLASGVMGGIVDVGRIRAMWEDFLQAATSDESPHPKSGIGSWKGGLTNSLLSHRTSAMALERWRSFRSRNKPTTQHHVSDFALLWRVALVSMLEHPSGK